MTPICPIALLLFLRQHGTASLPPSLPPSLSPSLSPSLPLTLCRDGRGWTRPSRNQTRGASYSPRSLREGGREGRREGGRGSQKGVRKTNI
jgi:hypothetical protein